MEMRFDSFKDASAYASSVAQEKGVSVRVIRDANAWVVQVPEQETQPAAVVQKPPGQVVENMADLLPEPEDTISPAAVEHKTTSKLSTTTLIPTKSLPSSPEDEWNRFLELASRALKGADATERDVIDEFSRLLRERNPFAVEAKNRYDSKNPGAKASTAYEQLRVHGMTILYQHGEDTRKPKDLSYYLFDSDGEAEKR